MVHIIVIFVLITVNYCKCMLLFSPQTSYLYVHCILELCNNTKVNSIDEASGVTIMFNIETYVA